MSKHIDHAEEARKILRGQPAGADAAQVHATLALVEQQRIANLLNLPGTPEEIRSMVEPGSAAADRAEMILKGLGL